MNIIKNKQLRTKFLSLISQNEKVESLLKRLSKEGDLILLGGTVRSFFENNLNEFPRDIDIVINTTNENLDKYFEDLNVQKNRYGGYKIVIDDIILDIWSMPVTYPFKEKLIEYNNPYDIVKIQLISYDAIAYNLSTEEIYDNGYFDTINKKEIHIIFNHTKHMQLYIVKIFMLMKKYDLRITSQLANSITKWINENHNYIELLMNIQVSHYKQVHLSEEEIKQILIEIL